LLIFPTFQLFMVPNLCFVLIQYTNSNCLLRSVVLTHTELDKRDFERDRCRDGYERFRNSTCL